MSNLYAVLGLSRRATSAEIKAAYWALAKQSHPDVNVGDEDADERIREINAAYDILGDPELRIAYDLSLADLRAGARRAFWRAAAVGSATCIVAASCVWAVLTWRQGAPIHQAQSRQPVAAVGPSIHDQGKQGAAAFGDAPDRGGPSNRVGEPRVSSRGDMETPDQRESDLSSIPETPKEVVARATPSGARSATVPPEGLGSAGSERQIRADPVAQPPPTVEMPGESVAAGHPSVPASEVPTGEVELVAAAPGEGSAQRDKVAYAAPPEGSRQIPALIVEETPDRAPAESNSDPRAPRVAPSYNKLGRQLDTAKPSESKRGNGQPLQREPGLVSRSAAALRWPSADEPFINLGARKR